MIRELSQEQIRWYALENKIYEHKIKNLFKLLRAAEIEPILIKGWAAARFYPENQPRPYSDIDIAVAPELYGKSQKILEKQTEVDLHKGLRKLDLLSWKKLYERSELINVGDTKVRVLSHEDHLRILCVHWLIDGGAFRDKLWDIYYMSEKRPEDFDWEHFLDSNGEVRRFWLECVIGLTHLNLGLNLEDTPVEKAGENLPGWFVEAIEREWQNEIKIVPLVNSYGILNLSFRQLKKRFSINPVQALVMEEGDFRKDSITKFKFINFFNRLKDSLKRMIE